MKKRPHSIHRFAWAVWLLAMGALVCADEVTKPQLFHCRLIWKSHPATQATVSWSSRFPGSQHEVLFRERHSGQDFAACPCHHSARFGRSPKENPTYFHHALLTALTPDTAYEIIVASTTSAGRRHESQSYYFRTAPRDFRPVSILFGGDSRSNRPRRQQMNRFISGLNAQSEHAATPAQLIAFAHVGDYVKNGLDFQHWHAWLTDHELTTTSAGRLLPLIPTRGNHDRGLLYGEVFDFGFSDDNYFVTQLSPLAALITLNTEASMAGDQAKWLRSRLATLRPAHHWLLAQYHRPAYPAVGFPSGALSQWVPLFDEFNLDLACEGDGHVIKRTVPIRDNRYDESGVVYIGEGGLAVGQRNPKLERWYLQPPGSAGRGHHIQRITFHPKRLTYECLLADGQVVDRSYRERMTSQP